MKLLVSQNVNKRAGKPGVTAQVAGFLSPGDTLEVDAVVYGEAVDGNYLWYRCVDGFFYTSSAFYNVNFQIGTCILADFTPDQQITILQMALHEAESVLKNDVQEYVGCGIGNKNLNTASELSLIVYVTQKLPDASLGIRVLPRINYRGIGILTDVLQVDTLAHNTTISKRDMENDIPLRIGGGIRPEGINAVGTRSLYVRRKNGDNFDYFLLTCYHVLLGDLFPVIKYTGGNRQASFPISARAKVFPVVDGEYSGRYDYAAVAVPLAKAVANRESMIDITDYVPFTGLSALKDEIVTTVGFRSGISEGKVLSLFNNVPVGPHKRIFNDVILTERISVPGDSGAPVVHKKTNKLIGFIIGGNSKYSAVLPFYNLALNKHFEINP